MQIVNESTRRLTDCIPFSQNIDVWGTGVWPSFWIRPATPCAAQEIVAFRRKFIAKQSSQWRIHVAAEERYCLYLDGICIGRGSERGDVAHWFFDSYDLEITAGEHCLVAIVWALGSEAPRAQVTTGQAPEFILASEGDGNDLIGTGVSAWEVTSVSGYTFIGAGVSWGTGSKIRVDGSQYPWGIESGHAASWMPAKTQNVGRSGGAQWGVPERVLIPAGLLPQREQAIQAGTTRYASATESEKSSLVLKEHHDDVLANRWNSLLKRESAFQVPAHSRQRVIVDLENYYCAYPELRVSGGNEARVRIHWAESLFTSATEETKGNRNDVFDKWFRGVGDEFIADGGRERLFSTLWWEAGRYLEIEIITEESPLTLEAFSLRETRYPLEAETRLQFSDQRLQELFPVMTRSLQMCAHETYMDCPYYEQLMYVGDTRIEALITHAISMDHRLPKKAVLMFSNSCDFSGLTAARYPGQGRQVIPTFSLWWIGMVYDLALWRGELETVRQCLPQIRSVLEAFLIRRNDQGLIRVPEGWHFMDWVEQWDQGCPAMGPDRTCGITTWLLIGVLRMAAEMEEWTGHVAFSKYDRENAESLCKAAEAAFWDKERQLMADDLAHSRWSEHAQCLAVLSEALSPDRSHQLIGTMLQSSGLAETTIYFSHYLFEALARVGRGDQILSKLEPWFELRRQGFCTTFERPEPSRSDCHAWGAHPLYHSIASILGIRPASFGFETVEIRPQLGELKEAKGSVVHPLGKIDAAFSRNGKKLRASICLPQGLSGYLLIAEEKIPLQSGLQQIELDLK